MTDKLELRLAQLKDVSGVGKVEVLGRNGKDHHTRGHKIPFAAANLLEYIPNGGASVEELAAVSGLDIPIVEGYITDLDKTQLVAEAQRSGEDAAVKYVVAGRASECLYRLEEELSFNG